MENTENKKNKYRKLIILFWVAIISPIIGLTILFWLIANGNLGYMPTWEELENPKNNIATQVISSDNITLGTFFKENRILSEYEDISPFVIDALVATEDERFFEHSGIDPRSLARAIVHMGTKGGGSTITQQLAKQLYHEPARGKWDRIIQKLNEWVMAVKLEKRYTKEEILVQYLNRFDFLNLAVGIHTASQVYFNKMPDSLNIQESAMLVGMCKNPSLFNPLRRPEKVFKRRNVVLYQMLRSEYITEQEYDSLKVIPLELDFQRVDHSLGLAPYYREYIRKMMSKKYPSRKNYWSLHMFKVDSVEWIKNPLFGWIEKNPKPNGKKFNIYRDGLQIHTTINSRLQKHAEKAVEEYIGTYLQKEFWKEQKNRNNAPFSNDLSEEQIDNILYRTLKQTDRYRFYKRKGMSKDEILDKFNIPKKMRVFSWSGNIDTTMSPLDSIRYYKYFLRASLMTMDPITGYVKAYVGGINYSHFQYDMVSAGRRQVGSTFKPILYSLALQEDYTPCSKFPNVPHSIKMGDGNVWTPKNVSFSKTDGQMITLKEALAHSNNYISAQLIDRYSPEAMVTMAKKMGITTDMLPVPSICLGTPDVSLAEMVPMFCTYGNKGVYTKPLLVTHITDKNGSLLATFTPERTEVYDDKTAYKMVKLLEGVINGGTSIRIRYKYKFAGQIYGKTGTTQNQSDGWFFGVTPELATGIWVGGEDRSVHFQGIRLGQGASMALPIWAMYMRKVYDDKKLKYSNKTLFDKPEGLNIEFDCNKVKKEEDAGAIDLDYDLD